jgi:hypothetical protein
MGWMSKVKVLLMPLSKLKSLGVSKKKRKVKASVYHPYRQEDWVGVSDREAALQIIKGNIGARHSDQQFNLVGVLGSFMIIVMAVGGWIYLATGASRGGRTTSEMAATRLVELASGPSGFLPPPEYTVTAEGTPVPAVVIMVTPTPLYTASRTIILTVQFTQTPWVITATVEAHPLIDFQYSYYDPRLGGDNCSDWNEETGECDSMMASGLDWRNYFGSAVACPVTYPLYTVIEVEYPAMMAGRWTCLDYCPLCSEGGLLDFLQEYQVLEWRDVIKARVYFP